MEDWVEVRRLFHRAGLSKAAIARALGMSRNTVDRLLDSRQATPVPAGPGGVSQGRPLRGLRSPRCSRPTRPSAPRSIRERLRPLGYAGRHHGPQRSTSPGSARAPFAARAYQRTDVCRPGEIGQVDWWRTGARVPVGRRPHPGGVRPRHDAAVFGGPRDHVHDVLARQPLGGRTRRSGTRHFTPGVVIVGQRASYALPLTLDAPPVRLHVAVVKASVSAARVRLRVSLTVQSASKAADPLPTATIRRP